MRLVAITLNIKVMVIEIKHNLLKAIYKKLHTTLKI